MNNLLEYKGYYGSVEYSAADEILYGKVMGVRGYLSYTGVSLEHLRIDFMNMIDDYLDSCAQDGVEPQKPNMGIFDVQISPELHTALEVYSQSRGKTLSSAVEDAIKLLIST